MFNNIILKINIVVHEDFRIKRNAESTLLSHPRLSTPVTCGDSPVGPSYLIPGLLSRHSSGAVAFHEVLDLGYCHLVEIPEDGVLET